MASIREIAHLLPDNFFADEEHKRLSLEADDEWQKAKDSKLDLDYARADKATDKAWRYKLQLEGYE